MSGRNLLLVTAQLQTPPSEDWGHPVTLHLNLDQVILVTEVLGEKAPGGYVVMTAGVHLLIAESDMSRSAFERRWRSGLPA